MDYLIFCKSCGTPKKIPKYIMIHYIPYVKQIYCNNCLTTNDVSETLHYAAYELRRMEG